MAQAAGLRTGGDLVVESLESLGAEIAFGLPGIHALPVWDALRRSSLRALPFRTELNAGFAADGCARVSGHPAPLILSTGPGALVSLAALMEAASSHVPVVAVCSQIPSDLIGRGRGYLHELPEQIASFAPVVKWSARPERQEEIPEVLAEAWRRALTPPSGPVFVEVPTDLLRAEAAMNRVDDLDGTPAPVALPEESALAEAARLVSEAERPVVWAGGGVQRSGAWPQLRQLAEKLGAPVATTFMGKGSLPEDHPLAAGSGCDEGAMLELLETADVVLVVGSELGAETTRHYRLHFPGQLVQIDAAPRRIGATYAALGLVGDAAAILAELVERIPGRDGDGSARVAALRERIAQGLRERGSSLELELLATIREALPRDAVHAWDMTILAYCASAHFPALSPRRFLYPLGSGTLGYAWPAALGAKAALPQTPSLAVVGDGGAHYGLTELATARQLGLDGKLLLVDDGGYGILREFQRDAYGATTAVDLVQPDFCSAVAAFGVPVRETAPDRLGADLSWAFESQGPAVLVLPTELTWLKPTP